MGALSAPFCVWVSSYPRAHRLSVTRRGVDALTAMVQSLRGLATPFPREDIVVQLTELRDTLRAARQTGEGTHIKVPGHLRDAVEERAIEPPTPLEAVVLPSPVQVPVRTRGGRRAGRADRTGSAGAGTRNSRGPVRIGQGPTQDQGRRRPRPAADLPRRSQGAPAAGGRGRAQAGRARHPTTGRSPISRATCTR